MSSFFVCVIYHSDILSALNLIDQCLNIIVYEITFIYIIMFVFCYHLPEVFERTLRKKIIIIMHVLSNLLERHL